MKTFLMASWKAGAAAVVAGGTALQQGADVKVVVGSALVAAGLVWFLPYHSTKP